MQGKKELAAVLDFSVRFGERVLISGGEIWRVDELIGRLMRTYEVKEGSVFILPHTLLITAQDDEGETLVRHRSVGDIRVNMEELTQLNRLMAELEKSPVPPLELAARLETVSQKPTYPRAMTVVGMMIALASLNYFIGGGLVGGVLVVLGIGLAMGTQMLLEEKTNWNRFFLCALSAFLAGLFLLLASRLGLHHEPALLMVITSIGLIPGIPLINACRELMNGRVLSGGLLFMTAFLETMAVAAGFSLAVVLLGGAL